MHRIDTSTAQKDKFGAGKNGFTSGNPQTGVPATEVSADILDAMQEEICNVIEGAGMQLQKGNNSQLLTAINKIAEDLFDAICPIGQLIFYDGPTVPNSRFIVYKAQSFDPVRYPKLAKKWPSGRLPADLRSEFIRGADEGRGIVAGLIPMMSKPDQLRAHNHQVLRGFDRNDPGGGNYVKDGEEMIIWGKGFSSTTPTYDHQLTSSWHSAVSSNGGNETNPRYIGALILCRCE